MRATSIRASFTLSACIVFLMTSVTQAETWTDSSGKFTVEAEFEGVEGSSVKLLKDNGVRILVPIAKLSAESKQQAKQLFEKMQASNEPFGDNTVPNASANTKPSTIKKRELSFDTPEPKALSAMPAFPEGLSLQQTVDFVSEQIEAGHLEVLWHALPQEMRDEMDSPELREAVNPFMQQQSEILKSVESLVFKAIQVLVTQKKYVLGSAMMADVPPAAMPMVSQGYDPAVGLIFELSDMGFRTADLQDTSIDSMINHYGPRVGSHMKDLMQLAPPGMISMMIGEMKVEMIDEKNGIIKAPETGGLEALGGGLDVESEDTEMTLYAGRWIPKDLADEWPMMQEMMKSDLKEALETQQESEDMQGAVMMVGMMNAMAGGVLDQLLAAQSQSEFDNVIGQSAAMLAPNLGGAFGGGGFGGGGFGGGGELGGGGFGGGGFGGGGFGGGEFDLGDDNGAPEPDASENGNGFNF